MQMMFFEFFFIIFNVNKLDIVSIVLPDFEMIIKRIFDKSSFFFKSVILSSFKSLKK